MWVLGGAWGQIEVSYTSWVGLRAISLIDLQHWAQLLCVLTRSGRCFGAPWGCLARLGRQPAKPQHEPPVSVSRVSVIGSDCVWCGLLRRNNTVTVLLPAPSVIRGIR